VFTLLGEAGRLHIDALATRLSAASGAVSRALVLLELKGLVRKLPGMYYTRDA
jgi:DNA processing protein